MKVIMPNGPVARTDKTWGEYLRAFEGIDPEESWGDKDWDGGAGSLGAALKLARQGWAEGVKYTQEITMPALNSMATARGMFDAWSWDVTGAAYDVGEYLTGNPECWLTQNAPTSRPAVRILVNITSSAGVPAETIKMRGAAVAALAMHLQNTGFAVEIFAAWGVRGWQWGENAGNARWSRVCVTDPNGGPMDTDRILFALAHPAAGRQLGHFMVGSGIPIDDPPAEWASDLYLPCMHLDRVEDWKDLNAVVAWVEKTYNDLTGKGK